MFSDIAPSHTPNARRLANRGIIMEVKAKSGQLLKLYTSALRSIVVVICERPGTLCFVILKTGEQVLV
jgi:hypothetical protein